MCWTHMTSNHNMSNLVINAHIEDKVARFALRLPHKVAAIFPLLHEDLLSIFARDVSMKPPEEGREDTLEAWGKAGITLDTWPLRIY